MRKIEIKELRELQMCILDAIDKFCKENSIRYTISGGTLLGAVRHKGFIPWDDDMDIQMPREDYKKFIQLWNSPNNSSLYQIVSVESGNDIGYPFAKMTNPQTVLFYKGKEREGVYVDIFPVDKVEDMKDFVGRRKKIKKLHRQHKGLFWLDLAKYGQLPLWRILLAYLRKPRFPSKTLSGIAQEINTIAQEKNDMNCDYMFEMVCGFKCKNLIPSTVFDKYTEIKFEDRKYMCVEDYDTFLAQTFGDYMKLPPIEDQVSDHISEPYWRD